MGLSLYTRNPFAALGFLIAWVFTLGRIGRLPWYTDTMEVEWELPPCADFGPPMPEQIPRVVH